MAIYMKASDPVRVSFLHSSFQSFQALLLETGKQRMHTVQRLYMRYRVAFVIISMSHHRPLIRTVRAIFLTPDSNTHDPPPTLPDTTTLEFVIFSRSLQLYLTTYNDRPELLRYLTDALTDTLTIPLRRCGSLSRSSRLLSRLWPTLVNFHFGLQEAVIGITP
jgi:hypothetical protein